MPESVAPFSFDLVNREAEAPNNDDQGLVFPPIKRPGASQHGPGEKLLKRLPAGQARRPSETGAMLTSGRSGGRRSDNRARAPANEGEIAAAETREGTARLRGCAPERGLLGDEPKSLRWNG